MKTFLLWRMSCLKLLYLAITSCSQCVHGECVCWQHNVCATIHWVISVPLAFTLTYCLKHKQGTRTYTSYGHMHMQLQHMHGRAGVRKTAVDVKRESKQEKGTDTIQRWLRFEPPLVLVSASCGCTPVVLTRSNVVNWWYTLCIRRITRVYVCMCICACIIRLHVCERVSQYYTNSKTAVRDLCMFIMGHRMRVAKQYLLPSIDIGQKPWPCSSARIISTVLLWR